MSYIVKCAQLNFLTCNGSLNKFQLFFCKINVPSNAMGENRKGLCQVNTAGGVELPIEAFQGRFSLVLQH